MGDLLSFQGLYSLSKIRISTTTYLLAVKNCLIRFSVHLKNYFRIGVWNTLQKLLKN